MRSKKRISKKVFKELAAKNVKKSAKDYFIYFFTLTFAVCLFYTFNSIKDQFEIVGIPDTFNYLAASQGAIAAVSVVSSAASDVYKRQPRGRSQRFPLCPV